MTEHDQPLRELQELVLSEKYADAEQGYRLLLAGNPAGELNARILNDLSAISALRGDLAEADRLQRDIVRSGVSIRSAEQNRQKIKECLQGPSNVPVNNDDQSRPVRIAILSFLFNWPSTGGGIIHTVELVQFLRIAGYEVKLFYTDFPPWRIGSIDDSCPIDGVAVSFQDHEWNPVEIRKRYRSAVDEFRPDHVIITDCWNFKPHLAEAMRGYSYFLRMQAQEALCPLNNLRLLPGSDGLPQQCPVDQLAASGMCFKCLVQNGSMSGGLHQADRQLSGVGSDAYNQLLKQSLRGATAVLVLNPEIAKRFGPWAAKVEVVTWGMNPNRFPWPVQKTPVPELPLRDGVTRILFAGLVDEPIKGFNILHQACQILRKSRDDFELVVTDGSPRRIDDFTVSVGWKNQEQLPVIYASCDICTVPTIAQDGLSRTSVEAMATGLPVIASRIGGLPFTVDDAVTGILFEPGNAANLAEKLQLLISEESFRQRLGRAGRAAFESRFQWPEVIRNHYTPLLTLSNSQRD